MARLIARAVVGYEDLVLSRRNILGKQRAQAAPQQRGASARGPDNRGAQPAHADAPGFSSRNEPITSASSGEVQKHSTASRGEQTTGSLRVLNEVLTSTGTPVRA